MSGGSKQTQQQQQQTQTQNTSSNAVDPAELALYQQNYSTAQRNAGILGQGYTGQLTAGFTNPQLQAQGILTGVATDPIYAANNKTATDAVSGVLGANPNTTVTPNAVNASTIAGSDLSPYLNPFQNDVIDASIAQNERARRMAGVNDSQQATASGAFGGSRSGVAAALTNEAYDRNNQTNIANLNAQNFTEAQQAAGTDAATKNQVGEFNAGQDLNAQQSSITNALAQAGFKVNAAGQLVADNNAALNTATTQGGILGAVGDAQQGQNQAELTSAYQNFLQGKQLTIEQQNLLNSALGLMPVQQTVSSSGTGSGNSSGSRSTTTNPGVGGILGGIASLGLGVGSLGTGTILGKALS